IIVLPILIVKEAFPDEYTTIDVTENGVITYSGMFDTSEVFVQARVRSGDAFRDVRLIRLPRLGRSGVGELAHARLARDGAAAAPTRTPTLPQVDLLADYRKALGGPKDDRGALLVEALQWLDDEALPLVEERMTDPQENDSVKAAVLG